MKYLHADIPWEQIKAVGFDMDGTLYDEFDFIHQVYIPISKLLSSSNHNPESISKGMLERWLEKGSSYPFIFSETASYAGLPDDIAEQKIKEALTLFRNYSPVLQLTPRIKFILDILKNRYELFLVSDGSTTLQWNKIMALGIGEYFNRKNIFVSGDHGKLAEKPGLLSLEHLEIFKKGFKPTEIVFIGDRSVDENYAKSAGFYYIDQARL